MVIDSWVVSCLSLGSSHPLNAKFVESAFGRILRVDALNSFENKIDSLDGMEACDSYKK